MTSFHSASRRNEKGQGMHAARVEMEMVRLNSPVAPFRERRSHVDLGREMLPAIQTFVITKMVNCPAIVALPVCSTEINLTIAKD